MAQKEKGAEDFNPKHRILGAVVLVAVAVIVVPMLLKQHEPPTELKGGEAAQGRDAAESPNKVVVTPVNPPAPTSRRSTEAPPPAPEPAPAEIAPKLSAPKTEPAPPKPDVPAPQPTVSEKPAREKIPDKPAVSAAKLDKGWVVQVGTFSHTDNANRLSAALKQHGHTVLTEKITLEGRSAVRLRVGPFADKSTALKAQARIAREQGVKGVVLSYP